MNPTSDFGEVETVRPRKPEKLRAESHEHFEALRQQDQQAREEGTLLGRYFPVPVGEHSYAYYVITGIDDEEERTQARVEAVRGLLHDITCPNWGNQQWIPLGLARYHLRRRKLLEEFPGELPEA